MDKEEGLALGMKLLSWPRVTGVYPKVEGITAKMRAIAMMDLIFW